MDALIERHTGLLLARAREAAEDRNGSVEERLIRTILALHVEEDDQTESREMIHHLHNPQNALMHQKTQKIILSQVPGILAGILKDGIAEGHFETPYPLECMELAVTYLTTALDDNLFELTQEQKLAKIQAFVFHLERMIGARPGQLAFMQKMFEV